jgi:16S rRNA (uracil1498-N3)-methyltransferase
VNLIIVEPAELDASGHLTLSDARAAHLLHVLRAAPGHSVRIGLLDGPLGTATVTQTTHRTVDLQCTFDAPVPPVPRVDLLLALPRPKVLQRLWPQLSMLGVGRIILTNAERVERCYFDSHVLDPARYRPLLIDGLQQARDTRLPRVSVHRRFRVLVEDDLAGLSDASTRLMAHPAAGASIASTLRGRATRRVLLAVGPEGGWSEFEQRLLHAYDFVPVDVGRRTLRSDTACIALLAVLHDHLG